MVRVIVVDDEPLARQAVRNLLGNHTGLELVGEAESLQEAQALIESKQPDAVFLDIEIANASGFDLLRTGARPLKVIFVTAHAQHAVQAFEFDAIDYLLKPLHPRRFAEAVTRLEKACALPGVGAVSRLGERNNYLRIKTQTKTVIAPFDTIVVLTAAGDFTNVYIKGEPTHLVGQMLGEFEALLPEPPFLRLGRSLIINSRRLRSAESVSRNEMRIWLEGVQTHFVLGRSAAAKLKQHNLI